MQKVIQIAVVLVTLIGCVGCDQATKAIAKEFLPRNEILSFGGDTFRLQYAENKGAFLSLGASLSDDTRELIFTVGNSLVLLAILGYLLFSRSIGILITVALSLVVGGGMSNIIDRIANEGYVVDFLNIGIGGLRTGIFNVADISIMVGAFLLLATGLRSSKEQNTINKNSL